MPISSACNFVSQLISNDSPLSFCSAHLFKIRLPRQQSGLAQQSVISIEGAYADSNCLRKQRIYIMLIYVFLHKYDRQIKDVPNVAIGVNCPDVIKMAAWRVMAVTLHVHVININWLNCLIWSL